MQKLQTCNLEPIVSYAQQRSERTPGCKQTQTNLDVCCLWSIMVGKPAWTQKTEKSNTELLFFLCAITVGKPARMQKINQIPSRTFFPYAQSGSKPHLDAKNIKIQSNSRFMLHKDRKARLDAKNKKVQSRTPFFLCSITVGKPVWMQKTDKSQL